MCEYVLFEYNTTIMCGAVILLGGAFRRHMIFFPAPHVTHTAIAIHTATETS